MYTFKLPGAINDKMFLDGESCMAYVNMILNDPKTAYKYAGIFTDGKLITVIIRPGYNPYNFNEYRKLEHAGRISDFFILKHPLQKSHDEKMNIYYIKLKIYKK